MNKRSRKKQEICLFLKIIAHNLRLQYPMRLKCYQMIDVSVGSLATVKHENRLQISNETFAVRLMQ